MGCIGHTFDVRRRLSNDEVMILTMFESVVGMPRHSLLAAARFPRPASSSRWFAIGPYFGVQLLSMGVAIQSNAASPAPPAHHRRSAPTRTNGEFCPAGGGPWYHI